MDDRLKALIRLLKILNAAGPAGASFEISGDSLAIARGDRTHHFTQRIYQEANRRGLIEAADTMMITTEGRAALARMLDPESGFRSQNSDLMNKGPNRKGVGWAVFANGSESPLERLYRRKPGGKSWIGYEEFEAGERLRRDFECAGLQPRVSANWIASVATGNRSPGSGGDLSDFSLDAKRRLEAAQAAIGPELAGVAVDVCCFLKGLETVERERCWPPRSAKLMLRTALQILVRHYGLRTIGGKRSMQHWGSSGYRPRINPADP